MIWTVEQQAKSGLGQIFWLKVSGPFTTKAEAEWSAERRQTALGQPTRVVEQAQP